MAGKDGWICCRDCKGRYCEKMGRGYKVCDPKTCGYAEVETKK